MPLLPRTINNTPSSVPCGSYHHFRVLLVQLHIPFLVNNAINDVADVPMCRYGAVYKSTAEGRYNVGTPCPHTKS